MKRHFLKEINRLSISIPADLGDYVKELQLLHYVPLSYLIADEAFLPPESLRFFHVDQNWTKSLTEGALSIGRVTTMDSHNDKCQLHSALRDSKENLHIPRLTKMHPNHRGKALKVFKTREEFSKVTISSPLTMTDVTTDGVITGFIMHSELVRMLKGLEVNAYSGKEEIPLLRFDIFSDNIALGLFSGKMTSLVIAEPKTGLTFGLAPGEYTLVPKDVTEENLGRPLRDKSININGYKNDAGRLDVSSLAKELGKKLNTDIGSAKLAFELIAVANRAVFEEG